MDKEILKEMIRNSIIDDEIKNYWLNNFYLLKENQLKQLYVIFSFENEQIQKLIDEQRAPYYQELMSKMIDLSDQYKSKFKSEIENIQNEEDEKQLRNLEDDLNKND